jgi:hypothetical protein
LLFSEERPLRRVLRGGVMAVSDCFADGPHVIYVDINSGGKKQGQERGQF